MKSEYERVESIGKWKNTVLYISTAITLILTLYEKYNLSTKNPGLIDYFQVVIALNLIAISLYVLLDFRESYIFSKAEKNRRLQYLDNSFETNFAGRRTQGYFTQDKLNPGFHKLSVNCFENVFHSYNIAKEMQPPIYFKALIVVIVFVFSAAVGEKGIVRALIEAILPLALLQSAIKLSIFVSRLENILENFKTFFSELKRTSFQDKEPEALKYIISYETALAWASQPLDSKVFKKLQKQLADEWEELKREYKI